MSVYRTLNPREYETLLFPGPGVVLLQQFTPT
jgi:hypothetical protein